MRMSAVKAHPILKTASELEYGYKIVVSSLNSLDMELE
jgi:hypothetical protein